jgi:dynein heavy chain 1
MNPSETGLKDRAATSPALFNRCVLNWFGDWPESALYQVGSEFTKKVDLDRMDWKAPDFPVFNVPNIDPIASHRDAVVASMVFVHKTLHQVNARAVRRGQRVMAITPRHFLDFINHFVKLYHEKRSGLEEGAVASQRGSRENSRDRGTGGGDAKVFGRQVIGTASQE